jgi:hypothetical protein
MALRFLSPSRLVHTPFYPIPRPSDLHSRDGIYIYIPLCSLIPSFLSHDLFSFFSKLLAAPLMKSKNNIPRNMAAGSSENFGTFVLQLLFLVCLSH